jgi:hypothetical protein
VAKLGNCENLQGRVYRDLSGLISWTFETDLLVPICMKIGPYTEEKGLGMQSQNSVGQG